ncbi:MAG: hypothetical protein IT580_06955 [Verrucomicrobiales bacterium]|nr:hypothetical protein [Verrucomicrobiales bacterium]
MNARHSFTPWVLGWLLAGVLGFDLGAAPVMFERVAGRGTSVPLPAGVDADPATRIPLVLVPTAAAGLRASMPGDRWILPDAEGAELVLVVDSVRTGDGDDVSVVGRLEGEAGSAVLMMMVEDRVALTIRRGGRELVRILPAAQGRHGLERGRAASALAPRCANEGGPAIFVPPPPDGRRLGLAGMTGAGEVAVVDIAFLYTAAAQQGAGGDAGIRALVGLALLESNDAYERSEARVRLRRVLIQSTDYLESGSLSTDLSRLSRADDGWLEEAYVVRDEYGADVVCLVTESEDSNQFAGMANQLLDVKPASVARGFTACLRPYLVGNYTLPHEVGHLLGCNHDRENASSGLELWSHGTRVTVEGSVYRTVMAYRPGLQFPYVSNPRVTYRGVATGVASGPTAADNVRTINATAPLLAAVREPRARVGFGREIVEVRESAGMVRVPWAWSGSVTGVAFRVGTREATARAGVDFVAVDRAIEVGPGLLAGEVEVLLVDNGEADGPRRFSLVLSQPGLGLALGPEAVCDVVIMDDEMEASARLDTSVRVRPGADYLVSALLRESDPGGGSSGGVIAGGGFTRFDGQPRPRLARVQRGGSVDPAYTVDVKYQVDALADLGDGRVALAGEFNTVNGVRLNHLAVVRADGSLDPEFSFDPGADLRVMALLPTGEGGMIAGGSFREVEGIAARGVVRLTRTGAVDMEFDTTRGTDGDVLAMAKDPGGAGREAGILVVGRFQTVDGVPRRGVAKLGWNGKPVVEFAPGLGADDAVHAVGVDGEGRVVLGGAFRQFDSQPAGGLIRLTPRGAVDSTFQVGAGADGAVLALARASAGGWWVAGAFTRVDGVPRRHVARVLEDGRVDPGFDPGVGPDDWVLAITEDRAGAFWIGGVFTRVNGVPRGGLASLLVEAPAPARFLTAAREGVTFQWQARAAAGQWYDLESSTTLGAWQVVGGAQAAGDGGLSGQRPAAGGAEFLRLRRRLE